VAYELGKYYASEGYVVVSGLAYGIDQKPTKVLWKEEPQLVCWGMDLISLSQIHAFAKEKNRRERLRYYLVQA